MKHRILLVLLLLSVAIIAPVAADSQIDIGINVPVAIRFSFEGEQVSERLPFYIPVPDLMFNYYFTDSPVKLGVGARVWTLILITGAYPIASVEYESDRLLLNAHIGGGVFGYLTPVPEYSGIETGRVFLPEISAAYRFTDWFSLGAAVLGVWVPDLTEDRGMGYLFNVIGRFRVR
ncbi:MAG: hypothetical protein ACOC2Q_02290 [Spirochaetota bacterium]